MTVTFEFNYTVAYGGPHEIVDCILDVYRSVDLRHVDNSKYISVQLSTVKSATRIIIFSPSLERMHTWLLQTPPARPTGPRNLRISPGM